MNIAITERESQAPPFTFFIYPPGPPIRRSEAGAPPLEPPPVPRGPFDTHSSTPTSPPRVRRNRGGRAYLRRYAGRLRGAARHRPAWPADRCRPIATVASARSNVALGDRRAPARDALGRTPSPALSSALARHGPLGSARVALRSRLQGRSAAGQPSISSHPGLDRPVRPI